MPDTHLPTDCYALCLKWLASRELSESQVRQRLRARGVPPGIVDEVVARLLSNGLLDDGRVALARARTLALVKRHGRRRILQTLQATGIDREAADRAVREVFQQLDERAIMEAALARRLRRQTDRLADPAARRRLTAYLVRQGFEPSVVYQFVKALSRTSGTRDDD